MVEFSPDELPEGLATRSNDSPRAPRNNRLPDEVVAVWGDGGYGLSNAQTMIDEWGLEKFLASGIHKLALLEQARRASRSPVGDPKQLLKKGKP